MSTNLGPDAQELLGQPAGAAPGQPRNEQGQFVVKEGPPAEGAAPSGQLPAGGRMVPLEAVEGEQRASAAKMQRIRASLEPQGYQVLDDGTVIPPVGAQTAYVPQVPAQQEGVPAWAQRQAERYGADPTEYYKDFREGLSAETAPVIGGLVAQIASVHGKSVQDWDIIGDDVVQMLGVAGVSASHPKAITAAIEFARGKNFEKLLTRERERIARGGDGGKVVGRFTEGAAPGPEGGTTPMLDPTTAKWANDQGFSPENQAVAAKAKTEREGRR